jgi:voltage-gated potassium channel
MGEPYKAARGAIDALPQWHRGALTAFVDKHQTVWDLVSAALTIVYVALAFRQETASPAESLAIWALGILFLLEFSARFFDSPSRMTYFREHWLDLVTAIPVPAIPGLRVLRLLRLLRFLKVGMLLRSWLLRRGWSDTGLIWPSLFLFWVGSAVALWLVEHDAPGTQIKTFGDALVAALLTAGTLGFAKHSLQPVTQSGQIISAIMVFGALGLWGFASSRLTQLWLQGSSVDRTQDVSDVYAELRLLRDQIDVLTDLARARTPTIRTSAPLPERPPSETADVNGSELVLPLTQATTIDSPPQQAP